MDFFWINPNQSFLPAEDAQCSDVAKKISFACSKSSEKLNTVECDYIETDLEETDLMERDICSSIVPYQSFLTIAGENNSDVSKEILIACSSSRGKLGGMESNANKTNHDYIEGEKYSGGEKKFDVIAENEGVESTASSVHDNSDKKTVDTEKTHPLSTASSVHENSDKNTVDTEKTHPLSTASSVHENSDKNTVDTEKTHPLSTASSVHENSDKNTVDTEKTYPTSSLSSDTFKPIRSSIHKLVASDLQKQSEELDNLNRGLFNIIGSFINKAVPFPIANPSPLDGLIPAVVDTTTDDNNPTTEDQAQIQNPKSNFDSNDSEPQSIDVIDPSPSQTTVGIPHPYYNVEPQDRPHDFSNTIDPMRHSEIHVKSANNLKSVIAPSDSVIEVPITDPVPEQIPEQQLPVPYGYPQFFGQMPVQYAGMIDYNQQFFNQQPILPMNVNSFTESITVAANQFMNPPSAFESPEHSPDHGSISGEPDDGVHVGPCTPEELPKAAKSPDNISKKPFMTDEEIRLHRKQYFQKKRENELKRAIEENPEHPVQNDSNKISIKQQSQMTNSSKTKPVVNQPALDRKIPKLTSKSSHPRIQDRRIKPQTGRESSAKKESKDTSSNPFNPFSPNPSFFIRRKAGISGINTRPDSNKLESHFFNELKSFFPNEASKAISDNSISSTTDTADINATKRSDRTSKHEGMGRKMSTNMLNVEKRKDKKEISHPNLKKFKSSDSEKSTGNQKDGDQETGGRKSSIDLNVAPLPTERSSQPKDISRSNHKKRHEEINKKKKEHIRPRLDRENSLEKRIKSSDANVDKMEKNVSTSKDIKEVETINLEVEVISTGVEAYENKSDSSKITALEVSTTGTMSSSASVISNDGEKTDSSEKFQFSHEINNELSSKVMTPRECFVQIVDIFWREKKFMSDEEIMGQISKLIRKKFSTLNKSSSPKEELVFEAKEKLVDEIEAEEKSVPIEISNVCLKEIVHKEEVDSERNVSNLDENGRDISEEDNTLMRDQEEIIEVPTKNTENETDSNISSKNENNYYPVSKISDSNISSTNENNYCPVSEMSNLNTFDDDNALALIETNKSNANIPLLVEAEGYPPTKLKVNCENKSLPVCTVKVEDIFWKEKQSMSHAKFQESLSDLIEEIMAKLGYCKKKHKHHKNEMLEKLKSGSSKESESGRSKKKKNKKFPSSTIPDSISEEDEKKIICSDNVPVDFIETENPITSSIDVNYKSQKLSDKKKEEKLDKHQIKQKKMKKKESLILGSVSGREEELEEEIGEKKEEKQKKSSTDMKSDEKDEIGTSEKKKNIKDNPSIEKEQRSLTDHKNISGSRIDNKSKEERNSVREEKRKKKKKKKKHKKKEKDEPVDEKINKDKISDSTMFGNEEEVFCGKLHLSSKEKDNSDKNLHSCNNEQKETKNISYSGQKFFVGSTSDESDNGLGKKEMDKILTIDAQEMIFSDSDEDCSENESSSKILCSNPAMDKNPGSIKDAVSDIINSLSTFDNALNDVQPETGTSPILRVSHISTACEVSKHSEQVDEVPKETSENSKSNMVVKKTEKEQDFSDEASSIKSTHQMPLSDQSSEFHQPSSSSNSIEIDARPPDALNSSTLPKSKIFTEAQSNPDPDEKASDNKEPTCSESKFECNESVSNTLNKTVVSEDASTINEIPSSESHIQSSDRAPCQLDEIVDDKHEFISDKISCSQPEDKEGTSDVNQSSCFEPNSKSDHLVSSSLDKTEVNEEVSPVNELSNSEPQIKSDYPDSSTLDGDKGAEASLINQTSCLEDQVKSDDSVTSLKNPILLDEKLCPTKQTLCLEPEIEMHPVSSSTLDEIVGDKASLINRPSCLELHIESDHLAPKNLDEITVDNVDSFKDKTLCSQLQIESHLPAPSSKDQATVQEKSSEYKAQGCDKRETFRGMHKDLVDLDKKMEEIEKIVQEQSESESSDNFTKKSQSAVNEAKDVESRPLCSFDCITCQQTSCTDSRSEKTIHLRKMYAFCESCYSELLQKRFNLHCQSRINSSNSSCSV